MKNLNYNILKTLFVLLLIAGPIGCGKDDGPSEPSVEELIIGKWGLVNVFPNTGGPTEALGECERKSYLEFDTNNLVTEASFYIDESECKGTLAEHEYAFLSEGEKLVFTSTNDGTTVTLNILTLDRTTLVIDFVTPPITMRLEKQ